MKILKWLGIALVVVVVLGGIGGVIKTVWFSQHGNEAIAGDVREGFIEGSNESCISAQSSNPANEGVSHETIVSYCACVSTKVADSMTNEEIASFPKDGSIPPGFQERAAAASQACAAE
ncbi:hypothetical protein EXS62_00450 [Candidatus Kaiserbacteria bacterium]|nr:hypothetical protein [Candidatus Kaiserbacteria bacterium]